MFKEETIHFSLSLIAGLIVGYVFGNYWAIPVAFLSGFFIDADHLIDYFLHTKFLRLDIAEFFSGKHFDTSGKVYLLLHGYEYVILFAIFGVVLPNLGWLFFSLALSNLLHLIYDLLSNRPKWPTYFLTYRIAKNFNHSAFDFKCGK